MNYPSKPFKNCYWLAPPNILAGEVPVAGDETLTRLKLESMLDVGIRTFINLLYDEPFEYRGLLNLLSKERESPCEYYHFPIRDMGVPDSQVMTEILDTIDRMISEQKPVYYHCYAGLGRTGIVSCCWLARHDNLKGNEIFHELTKIRKDQNHMEYWDSPQSDQQFKFVLSWCLE